MNRTLRPLLTAVRRRLRVAWAVATAQLVAPLVAAIALVLLVVARFTDLPWAEPAALWLAAGVAIALVGYAVFRPVTDVVAARAADRGLGTGDAFATALELDGAAGDATDTDFHRRVLERAGRLAADADPSAAVRYRWYRRPTAATAILAPAALVLALVANPQDAAREQRARDRERIEATADVLRAEAERLAEQPGGEEAARRLEELADELDHTDDLDRAEELADEAAAELRDQVGDNLLGEKAASEGLSHSLEHNPLPGAQAE